MCQTRQNNVLLWLWSCMSAYAKCKLQIWPAWVHSVLTPTQSCECMYCFFWLNIAVLHHNTLTCWPRLQPFFAFIYDKQQVIDCVSTLCSLPKVLVRNITGWMSGSVGFQLQNEVYPSTMKRTACPICILTLWFFLFETHQFRVISFRAWSTT